jgi:hypothetical protein
MSTTARELGTWFKYEGVMHGIMQHTDDEGDAVSDAGRRRERSGPGVTTAAETLVVPLGLFLDVATSFSRSRR